MFCNNQLTRGQHGLDISPMCSALIRLYLQCEPSPLLDCCSTGDWRKSDHVTRVIPGLGWVRVLIADINNCVVKNGQEILNGLRRAKGGGDYRTAADVRGS